MDNYEDYMEMKQQPTYTPLQIRASQKQCADDPLYDVPDHFCPLNETKPPPTISTALHDQQVSVLTSSNDGKWISFSNNKFLLYAIIIGLLIFVCITVMVCVCLIAIALPSRTSETNELTLPADGYSQDNAIYSLLLNITQENKRLLEIHEQALEKISCDNIKQIELLKDSMENLTQDMIKLVQRNTQMIQEHITSNVTMSLNEIILLQAQINEELMPSASSLPILEATVNQTKMNIDNIQQTMNTTLMLVSGLLPTMEDRLNQTKVNIDSVQQTMDATLPAIKATADETMEIVENVSKSVDNIIVLLDPNTCQDIKESYPASTSGYYTINGEEVYCGMDLCGTNKGWKRLAYLDMTDTSVDCPSGLQYYGNNSVRACSRPTSSGGSCASLKFPSNGTSYSEVCGRVVGYQYGSPDGIVGTNIDSYYVDGVSITSGNPRTHVWTLIAETREVSPHCPCSSGYSGSLPSFIGNDYFCESGNPLSLSSYQLYVADPLWDGKQCNSLEANCCLASGLPWFHNTINTTSDYLEMRACADSATHKEYVAVSLYELYVN